MLKKMMTAMMMMKLLDLYHQVFRIQQKKLSHNLILKVRKKRVQLIAMMKMMMKMIRKMILHFERCLVHMKSPFNMVLKMWPH